MTSELVKLEHAKFLQGKILRSYSCFFYDLDKNTLALQPNENTILAPTVNEARHFFEIKYNIRIYPVYDFENNVFNVIIYKKNNEQIELKTKAETFMDSFDKCFDFIVNNLIK